MQITEPVTMLTDSLLGAVAFVCAGLLFRAWRRERQKAALLWVWALAATCGTALVGGTYHGLALYLSIGTLAAFWKATVYLAGLASLFMLSGTIVASVSGQLRRWLLWATVAKFLVYAIWMVWHNDFRYVVYDYVPAMVAVLALQAWTAYRRREESAQWIIAGVLISFVGAGIQQSGFTLHRHFNHNDLYHVIQMGAVYLFYKGVCLLRDR